MRMNKRREAKYVKRRNEVRRREVRQAGVFNRHFIQVLFLIRVYFLLDHSTNQLILQLILQLIVQVQVFISKSNRRHHGSYPPEREG